MAQNTTNSAAFIEAQQFSKLILTNLQDGFLPTTFYRNVTDFGSGTTLNIKNIGSAQIQDVAEDTPLVYNAIDTSTVTLSITDYVGDAWFVTDVLRQDGAQIEALMAARGVEAARAIQEFVETRFMATAEAAQTASDPNTVNGFAHRVRATGGAEQLTEADLINMRLAFDKANVPMAGRVAIVDPVVAATLNKLTTMTVSLDRSPLFEDIFRTGFANEHQFVTNIYGWNIMTSNRLPDIAAGTNIDGTLSITNAGKANLFMSVMDDNTRPIMFAERQAPKVEGERNKDRQRDEFLTTARFGFGAQRIDTLGVIVTDATATA